MTMRATSSLLKFLFVPSLLGLLVGGLNADASVMSREPFKRRQDPSKAESKKSQMAALEKILKGNINEACLRSHIVTLGFVDLVNYPAGIENYCELPVKDLPKDALALIEKAGELNEKVATILGLSPDAAFPVGIGISIVMGGDGSIGSYASPDGISMGALPDWTFADFSSTVYTHELIHVLTFMPGPVQDALSGLRKHPFLSEAFPDLVSTTLHRSTQLKLGEASLPGCLYAIRNETPIHSLDKPFFHYYDSAGIAAVAECCSTITADAFTPLAKSICDKSVESLAAGPLYKETFIRKNEIEIDPTDEAHLKLPFQAANCRLVTKAGLVFLDNCDHHQFGFPLVSFFFRLQELTGKEYVEKKTKKAKKPKTLYVTAFFQKIAGELGKTESYECGFTAGTPLVGGAKATVAIRPLLSSFQAFRESLSKADRKAFERSWKEHAFDKMVDLDQIYHTETLSGSALMAVNSENRLYSAWKGCENPYAKNDPIACHVTCEKRP